MHTCKALLPESMVLHISHMTCWALRKVTNHKKTWFGILCGVGRYLHTDPMESKRESTVLAKKKSTGVMIYH